MENENSLQWQELKIQGDEFSPRFGHSSFVFGENVFIFGGVDSSNRKNDLYQIKCIFREFFEY